MKKTAKKTTKTVGKYDHEFMNSTMPEFDVVFEKESKPKVGVLSLDLGREDLNLVVAKINEIINAIN